MLHFVEMNSAHPQRSLVPLCPCFPCPSGISSTISKDSRLHCVSCLQKGRMAGPCSTSPQCRWTDERVRHDCFVTQGSCPPECSFVASQGCPGFLLHCCYDDRNRGAHGEGRAQHLNGVTGITYLYRLASHQDGLPPVCGASTLIPFCLR